MRETPRTTPAPARVLILGMAMFLVGAGLSVAVICSGGDCQELRQETATQPGADFEPGEPIQEFGYFYRPPVDVDADALVERYDEFILTMTDESLRDALHARGHEQPVLQYIAAEAVHDPPEYGPWPSQVAFRDDDWQYIADNHSDWFLYDEDGQLLYADPPGEEDGNAILMDPGNEEWRAFFVERLTEMQEEHGWHGVFLDNLEASLRKRERVSGIPERYPTDEAYREAVEDFVRYVREEFADPEGVPLHANIIDARESNSDVWHRYMQYLDGAMREGWAVGWEDGEYRSEEEWEAELDLVEDTRADGGEILLVAMGSEENETRQQFAYGSYLLVADEGVTFRYTHHEQYNESWYYDNYDIDLGAPQGERYEQSDGRWRRDFENGHVVVDPVAHEAEISLDNS